MKKNYLTKISKLFLLLGIFLMGTLQSTQAQDVFSKANWQVNDLNAEQTIRYEKLLKTVSADALTKVNIGSLQELEDNRLTLNIPSENCGSISFRGKKVEYVSEKEYSWYGVIESSVVGESSCSRGHILLISQGKEKFGQVQIEGNYYSIEDLGGKHVLALHPSGDEHIKSCGLTDDVADQINQGVDANEPIAPIADNRDVACDVDVLVLFTAAAAARVTNINTIATSSINITNVALQNSAVWSSQLRFNLVAVEESPLDETGLTFNEALFDMRFSTNAPARRNFHNADVVMLYVDDFIMAPEATAGIAWPGPNDGLAYGACRAFAANNGFVFSHELGHIVGARHEPCDAIDAGTNCSDGGFDHAHTWRFTTGWWFWKKTHNRKTLMYSAGASNSDVIQHFSNPNVDFEGRPTGIANERDNARELRTHACTVASFRVETNTLTGYINGPNEVCIFDSEALSVVASGPPGPYTYQWKVNGTGTNWNSTPTASSSATVFISPFPNYGVGDRIYARVQVNAPNGDQIFRYHDLDVVEDNANGLTCALRSAPEEEVQPAELSIFPNPSAGIATLTYKIDKEASTEIRIYTTNGSLVRSIEKGQLIGGTYQEEIDVSQLSNAVYRVEVISGESVGQSALVVLN